VEEIFYPQTFTGLLRAQVLARLCPTRQVNILLSLSCRRTKDKAEGLWSKCFIIQGQMRLKTEWNIPVGHISLAGAIVARLFSVE